MRRLPFVRHLPVGKLRHRYTSCRHPVEKPRWHALWLLARTDHPRTPAEVADVVGLSDVTVRHVLHRWNARGPEGVADRRRGNGAEPKLTARRRAALYAALQERPPDGGVWTGPKVARYVHDRWQVGVCPETGWRWLVALGFTLQVPRPASRGRPTPRPAGGGKRLATAGEAVEGRPPRPGGRGVGRGRGPARPEARHPAGVVATGAPAPVVGC